MIISRVRPGPPCSRFLRCSFSFYSSSSSSSPPTDGEFVGSSTFGGERKVDENLVLRRAQLARPLPTLRMRGLYWNSCSFIGVVASPLARYETKDADNIGYYTWLQVKSRPSAASSPLFQILLAFWDKMAEKAYRHLQKEDLIYVWGSLRTRERLGGSGKYEVLHQLIVRDLNYVQRNKISQLPLHQNHNEESGMVSCRGEDDHEENAGDRLRLWQAFFAHPREWWDNRRSKRYPSSPDFRHKYTGEELTLRPDDPPWVGKQLELYDSKMIDRGSCNHVDLSTFI